MNRREAEEQLTALAHGMRRGHIDSKKHLALYAETRPGLPLWNTVMQHMMDPDWSPEQEANWLEHEAINELILDDD